MELALRVQQLGPGSLVLIDGASGTGKTTLASEIERVLSGVEPPLVLHMDDLYPGWNGLERGIQNLNEWILTPRADGHPIVWRRYDWAAGEFGEDLTLDASRTLIVEGCGSFGGAAHGHADLALWASADDEVRRLRALARDPHENFAAHWTEWDNQFTTYVEREAPGQRAHIHVHSAG